MISQIVSLSFEDFYFVFPLKFCPLRLPIADQDLNKLELVM